MTTPTTTLPTVLAPLLLLIASSGVSASDGGFLDRAEARLGEVADSMVTVRYVMEQEGSEFGGFTQRNHLEARGLIATPEGMVVLGGEIWPDEDIEDDSLRLVDFEVVRASGEVLPAELAGLDQESNLAFVRIRRSGPFPALDLQAGFHPSIGDTLYLVGRLAEGFGGVPHLKPVSLAGRTDQGHWVFDDLLDIRFLGGPVLDPSGRAVGIVGVLTPPPGVDPQQEPDYFPTFVATVPRGKRFGLPVGIPTDDFIEALHDPPPVPGPGARERSWIGITLQSIPRDLAAYWELPTPSGVAITSVIEGSPAEKAGLRVGDAILSFEGEEVRAEEDSELDRFIRKVQRAGIDKPVEMEIFRRGRVRKVQLSLGEAPMPMRTAPSYTSRDFGMKVRDLTFDFLQRRNLPRDLEGVLVEELEQGGWADVGGLRVGDVIRAVQRQAVSDVDALREILDRARREELREVVFFVQRGPNTIFVAVRTDY